MVSFPPLSTALRKLPESRVSRLLLTHVVEHSRWHGLTYNDVGFPMFITFMGASFAVVAHAREERGEARALIARSVLQRFVALFVIAFFVHGGFSTWPTLRILDGVLYRLGLCYLATGLVVLYLKRAWWKYLVLALLAAHWLTFVADGRADPYSRGANVSTALDLAILGKTPAEGLLGTIPAIASCILGAELGAFLLRVPAARQAVRLAAGAVLFGAAGLLWALWFPINKHLWTGTYVLVTSGAILAHLAFFALVLERRPRAFSLLRMLGAHSLAAFVGLRVLDLNLFARLFIGTNTQWRGHRPLVEAFATMAVSVLALYGWHRATLRVTEKDRRTT